MIPANPAGSSAIPRAASFPVVHARFSLGRLLATPGAIAAMTLAKQDPAALLARHRSGDWGEVCADDKGSNDLAVTTGARMLSAYTLSDGRKLWVITEADRSATTLLLPEEYRALIGVAMP